MSIKSSELISRLSSKTFTVYLFWFYGLYFAGLMAYWLLSHPIQDGRIFIPFSILSLLFFIHLLSVLIKHKYLSKANIWFHISFFVIALGVMVRVLFGFSDEFVVTENSVFLYEPEMAESFDKGFLVHKGNMNVPSFRVGDIGTKFWGSGLFFTGLEADITFLSDSEITKLPLGTSVKKDGVKLRIKNYGLYPKSSFYKNGMLIERGIIPLSVFPQGMPVTYEVDGHQLRLVMFTDADIVEGTVVNNSHLLSSKPLVVVATLVKDDVVEFDGIVGSGQALSIGDKSIAFDGVKQWVSVEVRRDPGEFFVFAGFALALFGLFFRVFEIRRGGKSC